MSVGKFKKKTFVLGLTGGIATGKSAAAQIFRAKKIPVICADEISRDITRVGKSGYKAVVKQFGKSILKKDRSLDRKKIADVVFSSKAKLKKLERALHPLIRREIFSELKKFVKKKSPLVVLDIPLLFENGWDQFCDITLVIFATQKFQIARLQKYRGMTRSEILARIRAQMPINKKAARANITIKNHGSVSALAKKISALIQNIKTRGLDVLE